MEAEARLWVWLQLASIPISRCAGSIAAVIAGLRRPDRETESPQDGQGCSYCLALPMDGGALRSFSFPGVQA